MRKMKFTPTNRSWFSLWVVLTSVLAIAMSQELPDNSTLPPGATTTTRSSRTLKFIKELKNISREAGDFLKLRCEVDGEIPATSIEWYVNGLPVMEEKNRVRVKTKLSVSPQWSVLRFQSLETLDKAFYKCEASNGIDTISSVAIVNVELGSFKGQRRPEGPDEGLLPETYSAPDFPGGLDNVEFEGKVKPNFRDQDQGRFRNKDQYSSRKKEVNMPDLSPDEKRGSCVPYEGTACLKYVGREYVYVSQKLTQSYIEQKLQSAFAVISSSPDLSEKCSKFAIPSICLSTFPLCDRTTEKPRKLCREECELLEDNFCRNELIVARQFAMLDQQMVLPVCHELPTIGSPESANCVKIGVPGSHNLIKPHYCYANSGQEYRGTYSTTMTGDPCLPWNRKPILTSDHPELIGGHNYCRSPSIEGAPSISEPWCYSSTNQGVAEKCGIPKCNNFNLYLYVAIPAVSIVALMALCIGICCMRKNRRKSKQELAKQASMAGTVVPSSGPSVLGSQKTLGNGNMEMNSLLPQQQMPQMPRSRVREFPNSAINLIQELGEGAFGKVYKGELMGVVPTGPIMVAIKTLKPGANQKTKTDFQREAELMTDLRHPNIVCLLGVSFTDDPQCMLFEHMTHGDLHEFLITHSPNVDSDVSEPTVEDQNVLSPSNMSFIAIQVAAGMEYLASHHYVHRDLAARNCLVGENLTVKISDFGLSRDIYAVDYYKVQSKSLLPVRWMPLRASCMASSQQSRMSGHLGFCCGKFTVMAFSHTTVIATRKSLKW